MADGSHPMDSSTHPNYIRTTDRIPNQCLLWYPMRLLLVSQSEAMQRSSASGMEEDASLAERRSRREAMAGTILRQARLHASIVRLLVHQGSRLSLCGPTRLGGLQHSPVVRPGEIRDGSREQPAST